MRDLRDPSELGSKLLEESRKSPRKIHDVADRAPLHVRDYVSPAHPHDRYGDPRKIPSTMPNAVE